MISSKSIKDENKLPRVAVLMSTYNGEKYIQEQLDSIYNQQGVNVKLFVRDDGSSDSTIEILQKYAGKYSIEIIQDGENIGPGESFMRLIYSHANDEEIDYYAFADQDDIWMSDKLRNAVDKISKYDLPTLYSSNQFLYINGENSGVRHKTPQSTELIPHLTKNTISGCTFVFNKALAELVTVSDRPNPKVIKYRLHDAWLMLVAICCGKCIYDETPHMLYRIHERNIVGVRGISLNERLKRLNNLIHHKNNSNLRMITAQELLRLFNESIINGKQILSLYADYQKTWRNKKALAFNNEIKSSCAEKPFIFTIKVLTNCL